MKNCWIVLVAYTKVPAFTAFVPYSSCLVGRKYTILTLSIVVFMLKYLLTRTPATHLFDRRDARVQNPALVGTSCILR